MWNLKKKERIIQMNLFTKQKSRLTVLENRFMVTRGKGRGRDRLGVWD